MKSLTADHYRWQAAKIRVMAQDCGDEVLRGNLVKLAAAYDILADRAGLRAAADDKRGMPS